MWLSFCTSDSPECYLLSCDVTLPPPVCSGVSRQAQPEAAEESEHQCELVPVLPGDLRHPAVHHRAGQRPAALRLQGETHRYSNKKAILI